MDAGHITTVLHKSRKIFYGDYDFTSPQGRTSIGLVAQECVGPENRNAAVPVMFLCGNGVLVNIVIPGGGR